MKKKKTAEKKFRFDLKKSQAEIAKLKGEVRRLTIERIEEAASNQQKHWEEAYLDSLYNLMFRIYFSGDVPYDGKPDDGDNPERKKIGLKLYDLISEIQPEVRDILEEIENSSGCIGTSAPRSAKREEKWLQRLKDCFCINNPA